MKIHSYFVLALLLPTLSMARAAPLPTEIERVSVKNWIKAIGAVESPFQDYVFDWHEEQKNLPLSPDVDHDPDKIVLNISRPLQETIDMENSGEIEEGITYGVENYTKIDADAQTILRTLLFRWGRPLGKEEGTTYPVDSVYGFRSETLWKYWGENSYLDRSIKTNGGFAKDMRDDLFLLVRGDDQHGYDIAGGFIRAAGTTSTKSYFMIVQIRPLGDGSCSYKVSGRQMGQSYKLFGIEFGRRNFGFNVSRIRDGQKEFNNDVYTLKSTGRLPERQPTYFYQAMGW